MNKLQLVNAPADFSWSWFVGEDGSADIVFSSLTNFSLDLDAASRRGHGQMAATGGWVQQRCVYMPKITSIAIKARERNADLAASRLFVQNIGSISLKGPAGALPQCANSTEYSVANYIDIDVTGAAPEDKEHFYQLTNSWLQSRSFINRSWLRINHLGFDLDASLVSWDNLCSLDICCDVGFGTLVDLLRQLANLDSLHVDRLYAAELIPEIRDIEGIIYACDFVEPISTSVKSLEISGFAQGCVSNVLAASIKYLLLVVPLLEKAYVPEEVAFSIDSFIKQLGHTYPHLSNITFN
ncbi:hypothetical protein LPJ75_003835 [Coemansia sp. RSA 2598]|nr:hypothetical protein LPJ75_003835 [Coemansia sp. RSA 2598]